MASNNKIDNSKDSKFPIGGIFVMLVIIAAFLAVYYVYHNWCWKGGENFGYRESDLFLITMIGYFLDSWKNIGLGLCAFGLPVALFFLTKVVSKKLYKVTKGQPITIFYSILITCAVIAQIYLLVKCKQGIVGNKIRTPEDVRLMAFWYPIMFELMLLFITQLIYVVLNQCSVCGYINTLEYEGSSSSEYESTNYVPGKYEYHTADIRDENYQKVGEIETKEYVPEHSYTTTHTSFSTTYVCKRCGEYTTHSF